MVWCRSFATCCAKKHFSLNADIDILNWQNYNIGKSVDEK